MRARISLFVSELRLVLQEARSFLRHPLHVPIVARQGDRAACVLLYGIPFADWNAPLTDAALWAAVDDVGIVLRLPALAALSGIIASFVRRRGLRPIVIPTKTEHSTRLPAGWESLVPDDRSIEALGDKRRFAAYMAANGLGEYVPATYAGIDAAVYPCVLKRSDLSASWGVIVVKSRAELEGHLQNPPYKRRPVTLQALVPGTIEYATYCVCKDGAVLWHCTFRTQVARPDTIKSEDSVQRRSTIATPEPVLRAIETVLAPLSYSGPCNLDYKLPADGSIRIFEINPRLGGSLMMPQYAGELRQALAAIVANAS